MQLAAARILYNLCAFSPFAPQTQPVPSSRRKLILWGGVSCLLHVASHSKVPQVLEYCRKTILKNRLGLNDTKILLSALTELETRRQIQESNKRSMPSLRRGEDKVESERSTSQENRATTAAATADNGTGKEEERPDFSEYRSLTQPVEQRTRR